MKKTLGFAIVAMSGMLFCSDQAPGQNKDKKQKANVADASADDYKALARLKEINGIIVAASAKSVTFRLDNAHLQAKGVTYRPTRSNIQVVHDYKEFELDVGDSVTVKKKFVTVDYDSKGFLKPNEEEKKELQRKGYIAVKIEDVKPGNIATLVLVAPKREEKVEGAGNVAKPSVKSIVLVAEGNPVDTGKAPEKKKKG